MTVEEFDEYLKCGLGRCVQFLESCEDREPYRPSVLNVCLNNPAYDTQCEGTRAIYVYRLAKPFGDDDYFVTRMIEKMWQTLDDMGWDFAHMFDVCWEFAADGNELADSAVEEAYKRLYAILLERANLEESDGYDGARDSFERVCVAFVDRCGAPAYEGIIPDIGELFLRGKRYSADDFDWLIYHLYHFGRKGAVVKFMRENGKISPAVKEFRRQAEIKYAESERMIANARERINSVPSESEHEDEKVKTQRELDEDREIAIKQLTGGGAICGDAICKLIGGYRQCDRQLLIDSLNKIEIDYEEKSGWHEVVSEILDAFRDGVKLPREALEFIYERSHCSLCRECAVRAMARRGWLTDEMKRECLYDSNSDIVDYVKKYFK